MTTPMRSSAPLDSMAGQVNLPVGRAAVAKPKARGVAGPAPFLNSSLHVNFPHHG